MATDLTEMMMGIDSAEMMIGVIEVITMMETMKVAVIGGTDSQILGSVP
ncbi:MAG TPA: hypothetical protein VIJ46_03035 [Rhabdochlamydiaceae bacterium]